MRTSCTRFIPTAVALAATLLFGGGPSFAQPDAASKASATTRAAVKADAHASNDIANAGSKQDPQVDKPAAVKISKEERMAARARRKSEVVASGGASNAIPNAGAKQDPPVDKPMVKATK